MKTPHWRAYRDTKDADVPACGKDKSRRIDLGLDLLARHVIRGQCLTTHDIAAWCGCTNNAIAQIEKRALRKIAVKLNLLHLVHQRGNLRDHIA